MKKLLCLLLVFCMTFVCACGKDSKTQDENGESEEINVLKPVSVLYSAADTLNPYAAVTQENRVLSTLLFDSLVKTDNNFKTKYCLAESISLEGSTCTVNLKSAAFSDGTPVTASDVSYSFSLARSSQNGYKEKLYEVSSLSVQNDKTLTFNLTRNDPYFLTLIDFPVLKSGSVGNSDSDGVEIAPTGCGRYILSEDKKSLNINENYYGKKSAIASIRLINAPDSDSASHYVQVGAANLYYTDVSDGTIVRMSGKRSDVNLNRMIYIGVNAASGELATKEMRYAISSAVDRTAIVNDAYFENAYVANGYFNPLFEDAKSTASLSAKADKKITVENLAKIGYNKQNEQGFYVNGAGQKPTFGLLVNSGNAARLRAANLIKSQCAAAGIDISIIEKPYEEYVAILASGAFQLYLGETEILPNMDFTQLVCKGGSAAYGVEDNAETGTSLSAAINSFYASEIGINDLSSLLVSEMPQIPLCYRKGLFFYDSAIKSGVTATHQDVFYSIEDYVY